MRIPSNFPEHIIEIWKITTVPTPKIAKVVAEVKDGNLFAPKMPKWLESLPAGKYTVTELISILSTGERNVQKVTKKFCPHVKL